MDINQLFTKQKVIKFDLDGVMDSCRVCMSRGTDMSSIFDTAHVHVIDRIEFCTGILLKQDDCLPSKICKICLDNLSVAYEFKTSCLLADNMFRKFVTPVIKSEVPDYEMKQCHHEPSLNTVDHCAASNAYEGNNDECQPELLASSAKKSLIKSMKIDISVRDPESQAMRKKRGPYKKSKVIKKKKLKPVKKVKLDPLSCSSCKVKFENKEQAILHKKDIHRDTECWVCEICGKVLTHRASHYTHVRSHAPPQYACAQCDYKTWYKHDLVKHVRRHDGIKLFQCEYCTASYYTSSNLTNHIRRIHEGEKRYQCTMCDKRFYDRAKLNRHIDSHNEIKRFKCDVCHACFTRRCYWKKHLLRQHNVVTPPQRPGRQKVNFIVGQDLLENTTTLLQK